jgi:hypothetical protein
MFYYYLILKAQWSPRTESQNISIISKLQNTVYQLEKKNPAEEARYDEARPGPGLRHPSFILRLFSAERPPPSIQIQVPPPPTAIPSSFVVSLPLPPPYSSPLLPAPTGVPCGFTSPFVSSVRKSNSSFFSLSPFSRYGSFRCAVENLFREPLPNPSSFVFDTAKGMISASLACLAMSPSKNGA